MLEAIPRSPFAWRFGLRDAGADIGSLNLSWFAERAELRLGPHAYALAREGWHTGAFTVRDAGHTLATATKPSAFWRGFDLVCGGFVWTLAAQSPFSRAFVLRRGDQVLGSIRRVSVLSRRARADLPDELPLPVRAFAVWLVLLLWRRRARSN